MTLASAAGALLVIYLAADLGSIFGGWLPAFFIRRGWSGTRARLVTMVLFAAGLPISAFGVHQTFSFMGWWWRGRRPHPLAEQ